MKAVFLDFATVGPGIDTGPLTDLLPELKIFDASSDAQVTERIRDAEFVFANKIKLTDEEMKALHHSAAAVQGIVDDMKRVG